MPSFASGSLNAKNFGAGGGGSLTGVKRNCRLTGFQIMEHALTRTDKKTGAVTERFPTNTFLKYDIHVLDPVDPGELSEGTQYAQFGNLPTWRVSELGEPPDPQRNLKFTGGYLPSLDNEKPAVAGPFLILDGVNDVYQFADAAMFLNSLQELAGVAGFEDQYVERLDKMGVASLDGIEVLLDTKVKPKGKKAAADPNSKTKDVIVPVRVNKWPWESGVQTTSTPAEAVNASKPVAATPLPLAQPTPATPAPATAAATAASTDADALTIDRIKRVVIAAGGSMPRKELMTKLFGSLGDLQAAQKMLVMQRVNEATPLGQKWMADAAAAGHFLIDADSIMVIG